ncbi:MAG TPA: dihydrodipicolinate synthase family protein, partial [Candidatus Latescibacteria bacterium]|nr:dihydrodipicolinate synthase family protein [Candidatus Latescibacterota bacterium]
DLIKGIVALWHALEAGDKERVYELSFPISALVAMQHGLDGFIAVEKYLLHKQGVFPNTVVRGPVGFVLDDETKNEIDRLFSILEKSLQSS